MFRIIPINEPESIQRLINEKNIPLPNTQDKQIMFLPMPNEEIIDFFEKIGASFVKNIDNVFSAFQVPKGCHFVNSNYLESLYYLHDEKNMTVISLNIYEDKHMYIREWWTKPYGKPMGPIDYDYYDSDYEW